MFSQLPHGGGPLTALPRSRGGGGDATGKDDAAAALPAVLLRRVPTHWWPGKPAPTQRASPPATAEPLPPPPPLPLPLPLPPPLPAQHWPGWEGTHVVLLSSVFRPGVRALAAAASRRVRRAYERGLGDHVPQSGKARPPEDMRGVRVPLPPPRLILASPMAPGVPADVVWRGAAAEAAAAAARATEAAAEASAGAADAEAAAAADVAGRGAKAALKKWRRVMAKQGKGAAEATAATAAPSPPPAPVDAATASRPSPPLAAALSGAVAAKAKEATVASAPSPPPQPAKVDVATYRASLPLKPAVPDVAAAKPKAGEGSSASKDNAQKWSVVPAAASPTPLAAAVVKQPRVYRARASVFHE